MIEEEKERLLRFSLLYFKRGELKKAFSTCEQVLAKYPNDPVALELMGDIKLTLGELEEALSFYKRAKESNPSSDEVEKKIGKTALRIAEERGEFELKTVPIKKFPEVSG
ncbi:tetratricopeptide repeat protein, partial [bacterium]|nr:tetratricopeptide repeat protein [bacterium]